tara:strand:+ start:422 stop:1309 length:888 start_codon:yes stop_codon:yes gene_type:complete
MHGSEVIFYKYLSPQGTLATLEQQSLKWACPTSFNDPFDFPTDIDFNFTAEELSSALIEELIQITYGENEPVGNNENKFFQMGLAARRKLNKPSEAQTRKHFEASHQMLIEDYPRHLTARRSLFNSFRKEYSVLCLSSSHENLLMWAHYCGNHQGCVLGFRCLPHLDNAIRTAVAVNYVDSYPLFASLDELIKQATGQQDLDYDKLLHHFFYSKSNHWVYENEWRCVNPLQNRAAGYDLISWVPEELEVIYMGFNATSEFKQRVLRFIDAKSPHTQVYQSKPDIQNYALIYEQLR